MAPIMPNQSVADRNPFADQLVQQQLQVFEPHDEVELALPVRRLRNV